ncbi:MAG: MFS transporter [Angustibacter sp.]
MTGISATEPRKPPDQGARLPRDFHILWAGESLSLLGTQITLIAAPVVAVLALDSSPAEVGALHSASLLPIIIFGLVAGTVVDRVGRWRVLFLANLARALVFALVPLLAATGNLRLWSLIAVAFTAGLFTVFFDIAYQTFVPDLLPESALISANSRYEVSRSLTQLLGPLLAGGLVSFLVPAYAMAVNDATFAIAAVGLLFVRRTGHLGSEAVSANRPRHSFLAELKEGVRFVLRTQALRLVVGATATTNIFTAAIEAILVLYITRILGMSAATLGLVFAFAGVGALIGAIGTERISRRINGPRCILLGLAITTTGAALVPAASGRIAIFCLIGGQMLMGIGGPIVNISLLTLRQRITPPRLLGRVNATARMLIMSTLPLGAALGGTAAGLLGVRITLWACVGCLVVSVVLIVRPVLRLEG